MSTHTLAAWLRCPICSSPLSALDDFVLGCNEDHRFDANKRGYISLLPSRSRLVGDDEAMLAHRAAVLDSGAYAPITAAIGRVCPADAVRVLDAGCGTGHYLRALLAERPEARGLAMDLSPAAVRLAVRGEPRIDGLVADTWNVLPIRDSVCEVVLNVFAPRNVADFHRLLCLGGVLLVVVPQADHLNELRNGSALLDVPADKAETLTEQLRPSFTLEHREPVRYELPLTSGLAHHLVAMGPAARHTGVGRRTATPESATVAVDVLCFLRG